MALPRGHGLGARGKAYYAAVVGDSVVDAARQALVIEGARMADRLEAMNEIIQGKGVLKLLHFRVPSVLDDQGVIEVHMSIDHVMAEARQLQLGFERVTKTVTAGVDAPSAARGDTGDELAARRAADIAARAAPGGAARS